MNPLPPPPSTACRCWSLLGWFKVCCPAAPPRIMKLWHHKGSESSLRSSPRGSLLPAGGRHLPALLGAGGGEGAEHHSPAHPGVVGPDFHRGCRLLRAVALPHRPHIRGRLSQCALRSPHNIVSNPCPLHQLTGFTYGGPNFFEQSSLMGTILPPVRLSLADRNLRTAI